VTALYNSNTVTCGERQAGPGRNIFDALRDSQTILRAEEERMERNEEDEFARLLKQDSKRAQAAEAARRRAEDVF
jgi:hypothetical protein